MSLTVPFTFVDTTAGNFTLTLANGTFVGQRKTVLQTVAGNTITITPANLLGITSVQLSSVGESVTFVWAGSSWGIVGTSTGDTNGLAPVYV